MLRNVGIALVSIFISFTICYLWEKQDMDRQVRATELLVEPLRENYEEAREIIELYDKSFKAKDEIIILLKEQVTELKKTVKLQNEEILDLRKKQEK